jgi:hypothetical protein
LVSQGLSEIEAYLGALVVAQRKIPRDLSEFEVESAFGGLAIYPVSLIVHSRYKPRIIGPGLVECEHVSFNQLVRRNGGKVVIAPDLINRGDFGHTWFSHPLLASVLNLFSRFPKARAGLSLAIRKLASK